MVITSGVIMLIMFSNSMKNSIELMLFLITILDIDSIIKIEIITLREYLNLVLLIKKC